MMEQPYSVTLIQDAILNGGWRLSGPDGVEEFAPSQRAFAIRLCQAKNSAHAAAQPKPFDLWTWMNSREKEFLAADKSFIVRKAFEAAGHPVVPL